MNREKRLIKNSIVLLVGTVIPKLTYFLILPILTEYLTKKEYGTYDLITLLQSLLIPIVTLQIQVAAFRYLIEYKNDEKNKKSVITNVALFLIPSIIIVYITTILVFHKFPLHIKLLISTFLVLDMIYGTLGQIVRGLLNTKIYSIAGIISSILNLIFTILFIYFLNMGFVGLLICLSVSTLIPCIILFMKEKLYKYINIKYINKKQMLELLNYSLPMIPIAISLWIVNASDRLIISIFLGVEANAVYAVARKIPNIINLVQSSFNTAWVESASLAEKDADSKEYYTKIFNNVFNLTVGATVIVASFTPILFHFLIKGDYSQAYNQMPILLISMLFYSISAFLGGIYIAKKKTKNVGLTTIFAAGINLLIDLLLINNIGIYAASISTLISYLALMLFRMINIKKIIIINFNLKKIIICTILAFAICMLVYINNNILYFANIIISICVFGILNRSLIQKFLKKILKN